MKPSDDRESKDLRGLDETVREYVEPSPPRTHGPSGDPGVHPEHWEEVADDHDLGAERDVGATRAPEETGVPSLPRTDEELVRDVRLALDGDAAIEPFEIEVDVSNGVVTLEGVVDSADERDRATETAYSVPGVAAVLNRLTILGTGAS